MMKLHLERISSLAQVLCQFLLSLEFFLHYEHAMEFLAAFFLAICFMIEELFFPQTGKTHGDSLYANVGAPS